MYIINMTSKIKTKIVKCKKPLSDKIEGCKLINYFLKSIKLKKIEDECKYLNIINLISKKILSKPDHLTEKNINKKLLDKKFDIILNTYTPLKFINWFLDI